MVHSLGRVFVFFFIFSFLSTPSWAVSIKDIQIAVPNNSWVAEKAQEKNADLLFRMRPKDASALDLRVNSYEYPFSAQEFLSGFQTKLTEKPSYAGATFSPVDSKKVDGVTWHSLKVKQKDKIVQECWVKKTQDNKTILFVFVTAVSDDLIKKYSSDVSSFLKQFNSL